MENPAPSSPRKNAPGKVAIAIPAYSAVLGPVATDAQVLFTGSMNAFTGANIGAVLRWNDTNNWYKAYIDGASLVVQKKVNGSTAILGSVPFVASVNTGYLLRFQIAGSTLSARAWPAGSAEPTSCGGQATDSTLPSGSVGLRMQWHSGNTA